MSLGPMPVHMNFCTRLPSNVKFAGSRVKTEAQQRG